MTESRMYLIGTALALVGIIIFGISFDKRTSKNSFNEQVCNRLALLGFMSLGIGLAIVGITAMSAGTNNDAKELALTVDASVYHVQVVGHRIGSSVVIATDKGNFDLYLNQIEFTGGTSRLVKKANSAKYMLR